jgi:hypothetical protein
MNLNLLCVCWQLSFLVVTEIWLFSAVDCHVVVFLWSDFFVYFVEKLYLIYPILGKVALCGFFIYVNCC